MRIVFSKKFEKAIKRLSQENRTAVNTTIERFKLNPFEPKLRNHALKGKYKGKRAISAGYDLRIIYEEEGGHIVIYMLNVGTHAQVY